MDFKIEIGLTTRQKNAEELYSHVLMSALFLENIAEHVPDKLKLGYEVLKEHNNKLLQKING